VTRRIALVAVFSFWLFIAFSVLTAPTKAVPARNDPPVTWSVRFSPNGGFTDLAVRALRLSSREILGQSYSFTNLRIATALANAKQHGVDVQVIFDKSDWNNRAKPPIDALVKAGVSIRWDDKHAIAHNKVMALDGDSVLTGSFNWTDAAEQHNAENLLWLQSPQLVGLYKANWQAHWAHSVTSLGQTKH